MQATCCRNGNPVAWILVESGPGWFHFLLSALVIAAVVRAAEPEVLKHGKVYEEAGRFGGWPANNGIWSWGNEILVGFSAGWHLRRPGFGHQIDNSKPREPRLARSLDGGLTWMVETPGSLLPPEQGGKSVRTLDRPMDFRQPGFVMTIRYADLNTGPSLMWHSTNKGRDWDGPFRFPLFGLKGVAGRTDYLVLGSREAMVFLTGSKSNGREGRPFCAETKDGGLSWDLVSFIGPEPRGFAIMPSTVRLAKEQLITTVRVLDSPHTWIEAYASEDHGRSWHYLNKPAPDTGGGSGNPPSLLRLEDGRLCLTYGYRAEPFSIRAVLSSDGGKTWTSPFTLRAGAADGDLGYVRSVSRPDGKIVSVYYFNDAKYTERYVGFTIWDPR